MNEVPETKYVRSADGMLAYQVTGNGPIDILLLTGIGTPLDLMWDEPSFPRISKRLGSFSRTIWFEPRGMGASEGVRLGVASDGSPEAMLDLLAVLDGLGCEQAVLFGAGFSGPGLIDFAVSNPERVAALVLVNTYAHYVQEPDYPWGYKRSVLERTADKMKESWGSAAALDVMAPSRAADERFRSWYARGERLGGGPDQTAQAFRTSCERDLRPLLGSVRLQGLEGEGQERYRNHVEMTRAMFSDFRNELDPVIGEGDLAVSYGRVVGTNDGEMMGMPPTGKAVECETIGILRFADGQAIERWGVADNITMMQQLGLFG